MTIAADVELADNMCEEFKLWMKKQKQSNGKDYMKNTITAYAGQLKNATPKLNLLNGTVNANLFSYASFDEFEKISQIILAAPNLKEVDRKAQNGAYSSGIKMYGKFLKERDNGEPSAWIFQGNPKLYDVVAAVESLDTIVWAVNQYQKQIKGDDRAYIWLSGPDAGIIASGTIMCDPEMREPDSSDPYKKGDALKTSPYLAVDIRLERKFTRNKVTRKLLSADTRMQQLEILLYPNATNFRVTKTQEEAIQSIIDGSYAPHPPVPGTRYWLYSPGRNAQHWEEFYRDGIMGIGWGRLSDLTAFATKEDIKAALIQEYGSSHSPTNKCLALWQFANEVTIGDVVFAKRGTGLIIGCGIVESDYIYDEGGSVYKHIHKVNWTHKGEWEHPGKAAIKTLTDITPYPDYVKKLEFLFIGDRDVYTETDFLAEVYISAEQYTTLKGLLLRKKNLILQGAPGVGKTFAARRLAFSIMGEKDTSRVKIVQFHQSYSYEDFVMGYRPDGQGFRLAYGPFYEFCKVVKEDKEHDYFFIIDEINRGNLSKIFGELLMLIENDKRGEQHAIRLLYQDELFSVPANVHIIGMLNTADRSLAMIDYALRRRFAFFDMEPAFESDGFKRRQEKLQNEKFNALVNKVKELNAYVAQDESLGPGFRIGHSYFCLDGTVDDACLSSIIQYEIVPLLNEYWFDEQSKLQEWTVKLHGVMLGE